MSKFKVGDPVVFTHESKSFRGIIINSLDDHSFPCWLVRFFLGNVLAEVPEACLTEDEQSKNWSDIWEKGST